MSRRVSIEDVGPAGVFSVMADDSCGGHFLVSVEEVDAAYEQALSLGIGITILEALGIDPNDDWTTAASGSSQGAEDE